MGDPSGSAPFENKMYVCTRGGKSGASVVMMTEVPATPLEELLSGIPAVSLTAPPLWKREKNMSAIGLEWTSFSSEVERASALSAPSTCQQWHPGSNSQPASSSHAPPPPIRDTDEILLLSGRSARSCILHETSLWTQVTCYFQVADIFGVKTAIKFYMDADLYVEFAELLVFLLRWRSFDTPRFLTHFRPTNSTTTAFGVLQNNGSCSTCRLFLNATSVP